MSIEVHKNLSEIFEIGLLIHMHYHPHKISRNTYMQQLSEIGVNGESFSDKIVPLSSNYLKYFENHFVKTSKDNFFYGDDEWYFLMRLINLIIENDNWLMDFDDIEDTVVYEKISYKFFDNIPSNISEVLKLLSEENIIPELCWKITLLFKNPKELISDFIESITSNIPAFNYAIDKLKDSTKTLFDDFEVTPHDFVLNFVKKFDPNIDNNIRLIPTMILCGSIMSFEGGSNDIYFGLFFQEIYEEMILRRDFEIDIIPALKILGDRSKFEILLFLTKAPNINLEIAKHLELSAATTSHHMSVLLSQNLVTVIKENKKANYHVNKQCLKEIIDSLSKLLI